jgi:tetratricopeptide (TPR) repeat protein
MQKFFSFFIICFFFGTVFGQTPTPTSRSHVERFSTPEARAVRIEQETTEKLQKNPNDAVTLNDRALARLRLQKFPEAFEDLQKAIELDPKSADYRANLGYVLWKLGRGNEAIQAEREALKLDEKNYTANYQLGRFLLRTGDKNLLKEAVERLKKALELDARQYEVRFELIAAFRELGDTASALAQLDILQDARPSDARVSYVSALLFIDRKDYKAAENSFRETLQKDPNLYGAWQDLGLLYAQQGRWNEAAETFAELTKRQQNSVEAAYFLALSYFNAGKSVEAEREVRRALRLDGALAEGHTLLGIILAFKGNSFAESLESLSQAVALAPNNFDAVLYLGRVQYVLKDFQSSLKNLQTAVSLNPKNIEARFFLGSVLESLNESEKALVEYQEIVKLDEKSFYGQIGLGALLVKQGKLNEAILALNSAIKLDNRSFEAHWALGRAYILQEKFAEAEIVLRLAVELQPNRTDARYQYAITLRRLGKTEEAKREFDLVEKINRDFREGRNP